MLHPNTADSDLNFRKLQFEKSSEGYSQNIADFQCLLELVGKVCSINFEPPDNDLCSVCHVYALSRGAWIISILFILNGFTWG